MWYVYVFWFSIDKSSSIGQTDNLVRRIKQQLSGQVGFSKSRRPFKLVNVEKFLKSRSGRRYLDKILFK
jgi:predicted GIY-YIG superfamily endonuclease